MIFDMTDFDNTIKSLAVFLDLTKEEISEFVLNSTDIEVVKFLEAFNITDEKLLEKDMELVSLHSTTSFDNCQSIKEIGIINLQDAVSQETPLKAYLEDKNIKISIEEMYILFNGNKFDISKKTEGFCLSDEDENKNRVIHKFYGDYQVNGFLCHENVLTYGGYTKDRPEILYDLAYLLGDEKIELDWIKDKNKKHYIIKFKQPLNYYKWFTFEVEYEDNDYGITKGNLEYLPNNVIEAKVKKWVIHKSLYILKYGKYELYSYVHPEWRIPPKEIMEIMTEQEYKVKYSVNNNY
ncbi:hypothetical protein [Evansella cellulosilytica]|uniref:Uncharacterized protein n=1 Tax=Evansella cellulosilytica (strain ATCC 21833 / DSM 2522 / FERM P-1141 / JCM 9156 / N-4) TaxID=649639 RepID=E6TZV9_EVAC2|nr:hypothetical protein [Evansella cellulosilytica]ADU32525.1 hypothetical protein Bcell_4298 [Evansella cellulosilytica DSM 2522]